MPDHPQSFAQFCQQASDTELVDFVFDNILQFHGGNLQTMTDWHSLERTVIHVMHISGIIDNGGFEYLLSGSYDCDPQFQSSIAAHRHVGLYRGYEALRSLQDLFPGEIIPDDLDVRISHYEAIPSSQRQAINELYWQDGWENLREQKVANYIRQNALEFSQLKFVTTCERFF